MVSLAAIDAATTFSNFLRVQSAFQILATLNLTSYKYPQSTQVYDGQYFDIIVVGGGTAGCAVATRLAQMDETMEVLLIEAGGDEPFEATVPSLIIYPQRSSVDWNRTTLNDGFSQQGNEGHISHIPQGKMLGGTSSLSFELYSIENRHDFDKWASLVNDNSWNWDGVSPYFKRSQAFDNDVIEDSGDSHTFGTDGPIVISQNNLPLTRDFVDAFGELGIPTSILSNVNYTTSYFPTLLTVGEGVKQSSAYSYLAKYSCDNPMVLKNTVVTKVIVDEDKIATGVVIQQKGKDYMTLNVRKEIILSAGAINTPKILLHSGIGPKFDLKRNDIPLILDLPVGKNLTDHISVSIVHNLINLKIIPISTNPYVYPLPSFTGFVAITDDAKVPDYETSGFIDFPSGHMSYCAACYDFTFDICNKLFYKKNNNQMLWTLVTNLHPKSKGYVTINSNKFEDQPIVNPRYLSHSKDLEDHAKFILDFLNVENTSYFRDIGAEFIDPRLGNCRDFEFRSLEYFKCYVRYMMAPQWQYTGTCAMGSVVDSRMRVKGIKGLRIADASVIPVTLSGDIISAVYMLAEKLADIIKEEYYGVC